MLVLCLHVGFRLKDFSLNSVWVMRWLAGEGEGWSEGLVRSRGWAVGVTGPFWQPKGLSHSPGVRQEPESHSHTIPLSSLYFFHTSQSKSSILTWFLTMKLAQHKPVNVLSLKLACQLKIRAL